LTPLVKWILTVAKSPEATGPEKVALDGKDMVRFIAPFDGSNICNLLFTIRGTNIFIR